MDSRYASHPPIPDHSRSYAPTSRQPPASSYTSSHRVPLTSIAPLQTLPPLAQHHSQYTYPNSPHAQRGQGTLAPEEQNFAAAGPLYTSNTTTQLPPHTYPSTTRTNQSPTSYTPQSWAQYPPGNTASYPSYNASNVTQLPNLLPMPNGHLNQHNVGVQPSPGFPAGPHYGSHQQQSQYHQSTPEQQHQALPQHRPLAPTHVVGSQGRRGILPSAVGRPAAQPNAAMPGQRSATTPTKDAEGKFPCEHCNKNYLHAKHLKRHMLRHTGVRPYACGLCEDTFSRSDILKRHFAKCSVRRGNPTGASHLTHSRANKRKQPSLAEMLTISMAGNTVPPSASSAPPTQSSYHSGNPTPASTPTVQSPLELQGISNLGLGTGTATYQEELQSFSNRASRANSTKRSSNGLTVNSRNTSGPNSVGNPESALSYSTNGQATPDSLTTSGAATPYSLQHDGRLPFSSDGNFNGTSNPGLDLHAVSRPHSGPAYAASSHPHIMSSTNGSRHDLDLSMFSSSGHDDFNQQYSSHHDDSPHGMAKNDHDFQYPISGPYSTFLSK